MALLENAEIWFAKVVPARPNARFNRENPTWETQIRTLVQEVGERWEEQHIPVKAIIPKKGEGEPYWRANLRKKSLKDGEPTGYVEVVDMQLQPIDPDTIGNGSLANVRVFQYEYKKEGGGVGVANVLMAIQLKKHIMYTRKPREDDFVADGETEFIPEENEESDDDSTDSPSTSPTPTPGGKEDF
jgi:hypothetical protein